MEKLKSYSIVILIVTVIILLFMKDCCGDPKPKIIDNTIYIQGKTDTLIKYDTNFVYLRGKGKIQWIIDTIYRDSIYPTKPFISTLDTILNKDSIVITYSYPKNDFTLNIRRYDSVIYINRVDTLNITKTQIEEKTNWLYVIGGSVIGLIVGTQLK